MFHCRPQAIILVFNCPLRVKLKFNEVFMGTQILLSTYLVEYCIPASFEILYILLKSIEQLYVDSSGYCEHITAWSPAQVHTLSLHIRELYLLLIDSGRRKAGSLPFPSYSKLTCKFSEIFLLWQSEYLRLTDSVRSKAMSLSIPALVYSTV